MKIAPHSHHFTPALKDDRSIEFRRENGAGSDRPSPLIILTLACLRNGLLIAFRRLG